jgi:uronate dehydrogenase
MPPPAQRVWARYRKAAEMQSDPIDPQTDTVLITGAAGAIGSALRTGLRARWKHLRLTDIRPIAKPTANEEFVQADVADRAALKRMMQGVSALVYMTGAPADADYDTLFRINASGMTEVFEAARTAGVRRIVFASSNHTFGCYPITTQVTPDLPVRPDGMYGALKVFGEALLRSYLDRAGIQSVSLRIGTFRPLPIDQRSLATWLSPRDVAQLVDLSLRHPAPGCMVALGYSGNKRIKVSDPAWAVLGYRPVDNAEDHVELLRAQGIDVNGPWEWPEHGGSFVHAPWPAF